MKKILLLGNGGHAKSCIDLIENSGNYKIVGIISKNKKDIGKKLTDAFKSRGKKLSDNEKLLIKAKSRRLDKGIENGK